MDVIASQTKVRKALLILPPYAEVGAVILCHLTSYIALAMSTTAMRGRRLSRNIIVSHYELLHSAQSTAVVSFYLIRYERTSCSRSPSTLLLLSFETAN